jgi:hypothetical protein
VSRLKWAVPVVAVAAIAYALNRWTGGMYFWHPDRPGNGYNTWSGIAGSFLTSVPGWVAVVLLYVWHHNCHVKGCWRLSWHPSDDHGGHPVCKRHHPHSDAVTEGGLEL